MLTLNINYVNNPSKIDSVVLSTRNRSSGALQRTDGLKPSYGATSVTFSRQARVPGAVEHYATIYRSVVGDVQEVSCTVTKQYPDVSSIIADATVQQRMKELWALTISPMYCDTTKRTELGTWIYLNTETGNYEFDSPHIVGKPNSSGGASTISPGAMPANAEYGSTGGRYVVAFFHTHTPTYYKGNIRQVGISPGDSAQASKIKLPVIAYDYIATGTEEHGLPAIPGRHPLDATAKPYYDATQIRRTN